MCPAAKGGRGITCSRILRCGTKFLKNCSPGEKYKNIKGICNTTGTHARRTTVSGHETAAQIFFHPRGCPPWSGSRITPWVSGIRCIDRSRAGVFSNSNHVECVSRAGMAFFRDYLYYRRCRTRPFPFLAKVLYSGIGNPARIMVPRPWLPAKKITSISFFTESRMGPAFFNLPCFTGADYQSQKKLFIG